MWFCKHLKYCGVDNDLSRAIVSLEEDNSDLEESAGKKYAKRGVSIASEYYKDTPDRLRITGTICHYLKMPQIQKFCRIQIRIQAIDESGSYPDLDPDQCFFFKQ